MRLALERRAAARRRRRRAPSAPRMCRGARCRCSRASTRPARSRRIPSRRPASLRRRDALAPDRHLLAQVRLDVLRHVLEERRRRAAASRARRHLRREAAQPERLEDLLRDEHFFGAVAVRLRRERDADRVADALRRAGSTARRCWRRCPFIPMPGLGEPEVQRIVAARREPLVDVHQVLDAATPSPR